MEEELISIVIPIYNVEKYLEKCIESVKNQTYQNWELIIVDDCSTDKTINIIKNYIKKDKRITLIRRERNSGGCRLPRFDAILAAKGDFICNIDSDDTIEPNYLEKLIRRQHETGADIVLSKIIMCDEFLNQKETTIPKASYDITKTLSGEATCKETIGEWKISVSGWLAKASLCKSYIEKGYNNNFNGGFSDEVDQRKILLMADRVAMTEAYYFYRQQNNSIVHSTSVKFYDTLIANKILFDFIITTFKDDEKLQMKMFDEYLEKVYRSQQKYYTYIKQYNTQERKHIKSLIKESYSYINKNKLKFSTKRNKILSFSYTLFRLYTWIVIFIVRTKLSFKQSY
jgi:glycosyltransferase involved in cell wall biosynthesis